MNRSPLLCVSPSVHTLLGWESYLIASDGAVMRDGRQLKPQIRNGYLRVQLWRIEHGVRQRKWFPVHTLVLLTFVGPRPSPRHHGAHINGDRTDNCASNLRWALPHENEHDKKIHGTHRNGRGVKRLPRAKVRRIVARVKRGVSYSKVAAAHGLHRHSVARILRRETARQQKQG